MKSVFAIIIITCFSTAAFAQAGELDSTFGGDGIVIDQIGNQGACVNAIAIQPDGKIIAVGQNVVNDTLSDFVVVRHNSDGSCDSSFGINGVVITSVGSQKDTAAAVAIAADGKIVVAGWTTYNYYDSKIVVVRYNVDGTLDSSFGVNGMVIYTFWNDVQAYGIIIQPDGKIVVAGNIFSPTWEFYFLLVRFNVDGTLDTGFGLNGRVVTYMNSSDARATCIAIQADGKIIAAGYSYDYSTHYYALARYNSDGTLDGSFGTGGIVLNELSTSDCSVNSLIIQADQRIITGGYSPGTNDGFILVRYKTNGELDSTFGSNGIVATMFENSSASYLSSIALQSDGKIVATGQVNIGNNQLFGTCRYNMDGSLDSTFGTNGETIFGIATLDYSSSIAIQVDGKIVVGGHAIDNYYMDFILVRYLSSLDVGVIEFSSKNFSALIYPNPIHQTETLEYTLTKNESLTIALYDVNGKLIRNFISYEQRMAGEHKETLNIGELSSGNYFLTISNGSQKMTVKMVKQ